jgi:hypothetical protein
LSLEKGGLGSNELKNSIFSPLSMLMVCLPTDLQSISDQIICTEKTAFFLYGRNSVFCTVRYCGIGYVLSREDFTITKIKSQSLWITVKFQRDVVVL